MCGNISGKILLINYNQRVPAVVLLDKMQLKTHLLIIILSKLFLILKKMIIFAPQKRRRRRHACGCCMAAMMFLDANALFNCN